jgi:DNA-binding PadR family transcriptional regulator
VPKRSQRNVAIGGTHGETNIIKIMVLLHSAQGTGWQPPPKGTSLKTLGEAEEQGFIEIRGEFQKRQIRLTKLGLEHVERDRRRLEARKA